MLALRPKWPKKHIEDLAEEFEMWIDNPTNYWIESFAILKRMNPATLYELAKENQRFSQALKYAQTIQKERLIKKALTNEHNANFTKFVLSNTTAMREQPAIIVDQSQHTHITSIDTKKMNPEQLMDFIMGRTNGRINHKQPA